MRLSGSPGRHQPLCILISSASSSFTSSYLEKSEAWRCRNVLLRSTQEGQEGDKSRHVPKIPGWQHRLDWGALVEGFWLPSKNLQARGFPASKELQGCCVIPKKKIRIQVERKICKAAIWQISIIQPFSHFPAGLSWSHGSQKEQPAEAWSTLPPKETPRGFISFYLFWFYAECRVMRVQRVSVGRGIQPPTQTGGGIEKFPPQAHPPTLWVLPLGNPRIC